MSKFLVRAAALQGFEETVTELGGSLALFDTEFDIPYLVNRPEDWISYPAWLQLLDDAAQRLQCPHFGLLMGQKQDIGLLGTVGFIVQQAPTIGEALKDLTLYFNHHNQGAMVSARIEQGTLMWTFDYKPQLRAPLTQQSDLVAAVAVKVMQSLSNQRWLPRAIYLPHSAPADTQPFQRYLNCAVYFDADTTVVVSDADMVNAPIDRASPDLRRLLEQHIRANAELDSDDFETRVSYLIKQALLSGACSIERVSSFLAMNKRTLQRKLSAQGTSYNALLEEVRFDMACDYLRESRGSLTQLAHQLCYSELSVFSNAFRQRFGMSPREWKNQLQSTPAAHLN